MRRTIHLIFIIFITTSIGFISDLQAQVGISISPPKLYFNLNNGESSSEQIVVTNVSKSAQLDLGITLGDWHYNELGENILLPPDSLANSATSWISTNGISYLSLKPGETRDLTISLSVPQNADTDNPVHTAMLYITQMNPTDASDKDGANMKISVRSGLKLYQRSNTPANKRINIHNLTFNSEKNLLELTFENTGNIWIDGNISTDLVNLTNGKESTLEDITYFTLPNDMRKVRIVLPQNLEKGAYTATTLIDINDEDNLEAAELHFTIE